MMAVKTMTAATVYIPEASLGDTCYVLDCTDADMTVHLPKAQNCVGANLMFKIPVAANSACVSAATGETIDGAGSLGSSTQYDMMEIVSGGDLTWHVVSNGTFA